MRAPAAADVEPRQGREWWVPVVTGLAVLVPYVVVAIVTGSLGIAHNDDWGYRRPALSLYEHGHLALVGWAQVTLVTQVLWTWPFRLVTHHPAWSFAVSTAVAALLGGGAAHGIARRALSGGSDRRVLVVYAVPGFVPVRRPT